MHLFIYAFIYAFLYLYSGLVLHRTQNEISFERLSIELNYESMLKKNTTIRIINIKNRNILKVQIIESDIVELGSQKSFEETRYQNKKQLSF